LASTKLWSTASLKWSAFTFKSIGTPSPFCR
jgi:hypothetical protein